jgi:TonB family protein
MYLRDFDLREEPFGVTPDPRFLYLGPSHREALASLLHGIESGRGFMALIAEPGMGKSTLLREVLDSTRSSSQSASLFQTQCTRQELLRYLLIDSGLEPESDDVVRMHDQFNTLLVRNALAGKKFILVIDEAQNLSDEVLESVRLLSDFETAQRKLLQIILAGQPQLGARLSAPQQSQLRQRMSIICRLRPLSPKEVQSYIDTRLAIAGRTEPLFTPEAVQAIARYANGIPRNINNYCFNLLSLAYALHQDVINRNLVEEVARDLTCDIDLNSWEHPDTAVPDRARRLHTQRNGVPRSQVLERAPSSAPVATRAARMTGAVETEKASRPQPVEVPELARRRSSKGNVPEHTTPRTSSRQQNVTAGVASTQSGSSPKSLQQSQETLRIRKVRSTAWRFWSFLLVALCLVLLGVTFINSPDRAADSRNTNTVNRADLNAHTTPATEMSSKNTPASVSVVEPAEDNVRSMPKRGSTASSPKSQGRSKPNAARLSAEAAPSVMIVTNDSVSHAQVAEEDTPPPPVAMSLATSPLFLPRTEPVPIMTAKTAGTIVPGTLIREIAPNRPSHSPSPLIGDVSLVATVNERGEVEDVALERGQSKTLLTQAAVDAVRQWRYTPFTVDGVPVRAMTRVLVKFK